MVNSILMVFSSAILPYRQSAIEGRMVGVHDGDTL